MNFVFCVVKISKCFHILKQILGDYATFEHSKSGISLCENLKSLGNGYIIYLLL